MGAARTSGKEKSVLRSITPFFKSIWRATLPRLAILHGWLAYGFSFLQIRRSYVVQVWPGEHDLDKARRVAVFMHYDGGGQVADFVTYYLRQIVEAGFTILFVSNSPKLTEEAL